MGDSENVQQPSKKRGALKQLSRDNPGLDDDDDNSAELASGTFKKASDEVLASRRIFRVKRKEPSAAPAAAPNPFAGIQLVPTTAPASTAVGTNAPLAESKLAPAEAVVEDNQKASDIEEGDEVDSKKVDVKDAAGEETEKTKEEDDNHCGKSADDQVAAAEVAQTVSCDTNVNNNAVEGTDQTEVPLEKDSGGDQAEKNEKEGNGIEEADKNGDNGAFSSFQQHSSNKNAFTGLASTEASGSSFSFGLVSQDGSTGTGSLFGFGLPSSNNSSLFGATGSSIIKKSEGSGFPPKQEVSTETGEENEKVAFSADSIMFEYLDGGWKERGKGELKVNVSSNGGKARLVMRAKGNYRLILNASLYPEMKLAAMDKKGITFACVNSVSEGKEGLSTFALKFKDSTIVEEFRVAIDKHKDSKPMEKAAEESALPLKTPENSPTATDT
ncbi:Ran binding domain [Arabidopsis suecica]|uniref:Ran binding domain n=1 Tax=Arabidopsis suecica TaxID=45249 RepID=A0A8T2CPV2_ARASU|nr:Ran binding domain [Arabidopsis suecica]